MTNGALAGGVETVGTGGDSGRTYVLAQRTGETGAVEGVAKRTSRAVEARCATEVEPEGATCTARCCRSTSGAWVGA